jgi:hypothetical protein
MPSVKKSQAKRLHVLRRALRSTKARAEFVNAFVYILNYKLDTQTPDSRRDANYFRWHDSGDLQSKEHMYMICEIANRTPTIEHYLPTKEKAHIDSRKPDNLLVRVSAAIVDEPHDYYGVPTSVVYTATPPRGYFVCPATTNNHQCGNCRKCWDITVDVAYKKI